MNNRYPGIDNRFVICDICGFKFRVKDTVRISDKYNTLNQMIVCRKDFEKTNSQAYPITIREELLVNKGYVRPEVMPVYVEEEGNEYLPSAPTNVQAHLHPLNNTILITWTGPDYIGSSRIIGYNITKAEPQLSGQDPFVLNTYSEAPEYEDTISDINGSYTFTVAAITEMGMGPYSDIGYYPAQANNSDINYLAASQTGAVLATGDGTALILEVF